MSDQAYRQNGEEIALSGYLQKKTRDGRWQKRWFETNGVYLTYYKSKKMEKLLAALSLPQVGGIRIIPPEEDKDRMEGLFALELSTRVYTLRAKSNAEAELWVKTLSKLRAQGITSTSEISPAELSSQQNPIRESVGRSKLLSGVEQGSSSPRPKASWIKGVTSWLRSCC
jgi:hypothetical protein